MFLRILLGVMCVAWAQRAVARPASPPTGLITVPAAEAAGLRSGADRLGEEIRALATAPGVRRDLIPDVVIFHKAVDWALRFGEFQHTNEIPEARSQLALGFARAKALREGKPTWLVSTGLVVRGFVSRIDGSVQPYGVVVGPGFRPGGRLDVWLHGRDDKLTELRFLRERMRSAGEFAPMDALVVHPYGRYCNAFKFAGETDVLEAMEHATASYGASKADRSIRGFSMGGAGTWHLAAHHPGLWKAAAPGAGFAETAEYTGVLLKGTPPPVWEQVLWGWYDATVFAANLRQVPTLAYSGENDRQIQAARVMERAMRQEGLQLEHLIGPGVEHKYEPATKRELAARFDARMGRPRPVLLALDLVTTTLRYPAGEGDVWARFEGLERHWQPARIRASVETSGRVRVTTKGVTALALARPPGVTGTGFEVDLDGDRIVLRGAGAQDGWWPLRRAGGGWEPGSPAGPVKRRGLQGPIDDAFLEAFVVVVPGRSRPGHPVDAWVDRSWRQFTNDWRAQFRGVCEVIPDSEATDARVGRRNVVAWGAPESNAYLRRVAGGLPVRWGRGRFELGGRWRDAGSEVPVLIAPNPRVPDRYVVVNSGHTFAAWDGTNARQTPRLPDWAVMKPGAGGEASVVDAGFFDERWR